MHPRLSPPAAGKTKILVSRATSSFALLINIMTRRRLQVAKPTQNLNIRLRSPSSGFQMPFSSPLFHLRPNSDSLRRFADSSSRRAEQQQRRFAFRHRAFLSFFTILVALVVFVLTRFHCEHKKIESELQPLNARIVSRLKQIDEPELFQSPGNDRPQFSGSLPRGIVEPTSDLELKPLWNKSRLKVSSAETNAALLAIPVGIKQKKNVDVVARKFLSENFSVILFHYDGNVDGWHDLGWSNNAIHITALNQTKWWFAKRFLHPDVLSAYDYIFLWDEDLGVEKFHPGRYLRIMISEGLEISQPALDPHQSEVHHRITIRNRTSKVHRRVYGFHGSLNCSDDSKGPPCAGWVEGMAPVFSQAAWRCVWHLIQNDLIHGWGLDMKLGYCAQGDPTKKVGVIDSEFIIHMGIQSLGGSSEDKHSDDHHSQHGASEAHNDMVIDLGSNANHDRFPDPRSTNLRSRVGKSTDQGSHAQHGTSINLRTHAHSDRTNSQRSRARKNRPISLRSPAHQDRSIDQRSHIRRQSTAELEIFRQRWELAVKEDEDWVDPFENKEKGKRKGKG